MRVRGLFPAPAVLAVFAVAGLLAGCQDCGKTTGGTTEVEASAPADAAPRAVPDGGMINATPVPTATVSAMVNPDNLPAYTGATGSIEGTISVTGDPPPATPNDFSRCPDAEKTWGHGFREGPPLGKGARALGDAVVVVTGYKGFFLPENAEAKQLQIEGCGYGTRTTTLTFGQRVEVKNLTKDFWAPVLEPQRSVVLMLATPGGDPVKIYPKAPGHHLLMDHDRKYVVVDVYAFLHPLHTASDSNGRYRIDGVPVGKLKVGTMHPQITGAKEVELTVEAGVVHKVDLTLNHVKREAAAPPPYDASAPPPLH